MVSGILPSWDISPRIVAHKLYQVPGRMEGGIYITLMGKYHKQLGYSASVKSVVKQSLFYVKVGIQAYFFLSRK